MTLKIIIHPNFRNGGAERSALNANPDWIFTYGQYIDREFANTFTNIKEFRSRQEIIKEILKLKTENKSVDIHTNQLSTCYFWILNLLVGIKITHTQRLSLAGEIFLTNSRLKKLLVYFVFVSSVFFVSVRIPSQELKFDFPFRKSKIVVVNNVIFDGTFSYNDLRLAKERTRDIVIISRDAPEKKLRETLNLISQTTDKQLSITVIGAECDNLWLNLNIVSYPLIAEKKELLELVSEHKIGVLFSAYEGFGNVIVDFIVSGVWPVINQVKWGPGEIIERYKVGEILNWNWQSSREKMEREASKINEILQRNNSIPATVSKLAFKNHSPHEI